MASNSNSRARRAWTTDADVIRSEPTQQPLHPSHHISPSHCTAHPTNNNHPRTKSMSPRLRLTARHLKPALQRQPSPLTILTSRTSPATMSTFTLPDSNTSVTSTPDLSEDDLLAFPAFKIWITTLQHSLARQQNPSHEFHADPYILRKIDVQSIDRFGGGRLGFVKLKADVSNRAGEKLPGSVFLRGGSVGMLVSYIPSYLEDEWVQR